MKALYLGKTALAALALAQLGDVITTNTAIASGGTEGNPVMALTIDNLGPLWWLPKAALGLWLIYEALGLRAISKRQVIVLSACFKIYALTLLSNVFHWI